MAIGSGPCGAWPLRWPCETDTVSPGMLESAALAATEILDALTGYQFGLCTVTLRPCRDECGPGSPWPGESWPRPALVGGQWFNMVCGDCTTGCSCTAVSTVRLPAPVHDVIEILIGGTPLEPGDWLLYDSSLLVRASGLSWPDCNDLSLPDTEPGTWSITAEYGQPVPESGQWAAGELACEWLRGLAGEDCRIPANVTQLVRQGVTLSFPDITQALNDGLTGLGMVDRFVRAVNPHGLRTRSRTYSVDHPPHHRAVVTGESS